MNAKKITFLVVALILIGAGIFVLLLYVNNGNDSTYRYEYKLDYMDVRYTDEVSIHINKYNIETNQGKYYTGIADITLYRYINAHYGLTEAQTDFIQYSMTPEYIEGLSADNKFISGKLMDPKTKQQIGHWIYDLDKDDFKEVILYGLTPVQ